jgi:hypothetical protein
MPSPTLFFEAPIGTRVSMSDRRSNVFVPQSAHL